MNSLGFVGSFLLSLFGCVFLLVAGILCYGIFKGFWRKDVLPGIVMAIVVSGVGGIVVLWLVFF